MDFVYRLGKFCGILWNPSETFRVLAIPGASWRVLATLGKTKQKKKQPDDSNILVTLGRKANKKEEVLTNST